MRLTFLTGIIFSFCVVFSSYGFDDRDAVQEVKLDDVVLKYSPTGSDSWFPYYIYQHPKKGIIPEVITLIFELASINGQETFLPPARTNLALINGEIDIDFINPDWLPEREKSDQFLFSDAILPIKESYIALSSSDMNQLDKLLQQSANVEIGTVRGYYYHNDEFFKRHDFSSEKNILLALQRQRINYAICDNITAKYWAKELDVSIVFGEVHSDGYLHMRIRKEYAYLLPRINEAIAFLKQQQSIEKIIANYLN